MDFYKQTIVNLFVLVSLILGPTLNAYATCEALINLSSDSTTKFVLPIKSPLSDASDKIEISPRDKIPMIVRGSDERLPLRSKGPVIPLKEKYDVVIVGGGLSGLTAALKLVEAGKRVLILEREPDVGGLASGDSSSPVQYDRGAAYWTQMNRENYEFLKHIGLGDYKKRYEIREPIDSYLHEGKMYEGVWEHETLEKLPASFALFARELTLMYNEERFPDQPIESSDPQSLILDNITAAQMIRQMPFRLKARKDFRSKELYAKFISDTRLDPRDPMKDVIDFVDLYSRSALGTTTDNISAVAFGNFYISELEPRYTSPLGSGIIAQKIFNKIKESGLATFKTSSPVLEIANKDSGADVTFLQEDGTYSVSAPKVIFAATINNAPKIIKDFEKQAPQHAQIIKDLKYAHYSVHVVRVKGHPIRNTYDLWVRNKDYKLEDPTDYILGRWMDPSIDGYKDYRDFSKDPVDNEGIITIYHPLGVQAVGKGYSKEDAIRIAEDAVRHMLSTLGPEAKKNGKKIEIELVETNRWAYSIHIARPGYMSHDVPILTQPVGHIVLSTSNLGTPSVEEALYRGFNAADRLLKELPH